MKKGLKIFGEAGAQAVITEMQQLHDRDVINRDVIIPKRTHADTGGEAPLPTISHVPETKAMRMHQGAWLRGRL